jgi:acyl-CoA synthetase (NDP forming)
VLGDPAFDAAIVLFVPTVGTDEHAVGEAISRAAAAVPDKPVLCVFISAKGAPTSLRSAANVPCFAYPEAAARALGRAAERGEWLRRPEGEAPPIERDLDKAHEVVREAIATGGGWLDAAQTRRLFDAYGLPLVPERLAATPEEAIGAARELGYPVVLKTAAPGAHKTEEGGVILDLGDEESVQAAAKRLGGSVLVQPFVRGGTELLAGAIQDPVFGPLVAFGPGGVFAELIGEAQFRLAPLTDRDARELVQTGKAGRLVAGFRGAPAADADALVDLLIRLSLLAEEVPEAVELDLNPVLALPNGCFAVDARVRVAGRVEQRRTKSW